MGKLKLLKKVLGLVEENEDTVAKAVSKRTSKLDEEDVKKGIDRASDAADRKTK